MQITRALIGAGVVVRKSPATFFLASSLVVVHILLQLFFGLNLFFTPQLGIIIWGQVNELIFLYPLLNSYRFLSSIFVHGSIVHLASNLMFLLIFGLKAEDESSYRSIGTLLIFIGAGLGGSIASLILGPMIISVGASGAIFGLLGADLVLGRKEFRRGLLTAALFGSAFLLLTISSGDINVVAHAAGLIVGAGEGLLIQKICNSKEVRKIWNGLRMKARTTYFTAREE